MPNQPTYCYYCGNPGAEIPLKISDSFTANTAVRCAYSTVMCADCESIMFGEIQQVWFFNRDRQAWSRLYMRGMSQLRQNGQIIAPTLLPAEEHIAVSASGAVGKPETYPVLESVPTRVEMREWIINPPEPPFKIILSESGQKHLLFLARTGLSRDYFPVQFETDSLLIDRAQFIHLLKTYETLLNLSFSKTEINSGHYRSDRLAANFDQWQPLEAIIAPERLGGQPSRLLQLISHVAQRPEYTPPSVPELSHEPAIPEAPVATVAQLSLF